MNAPRLRLERSYAGFAASDRSRFPFSSPSLVHCSLPRLNIKVNLIPLSIPSLPCQFTSLPRRFRHSRVCVRASRGRFHFRPFRRWPVGSTRSLAWSISGFGVGVVFSFEVATPPPSCQIGERRGGGNFIRTAWIQVLQAQIGGKKGGTLLGGVTLLGIGLIR